MLSRFAILFALLTIIAAQTQQQQIVTLIHVPDCFAASIISAGPSATWYSLRYQSSSSADCESVPTYYGFTAISGSTTFGVTLTVKDDEEVKTALIDCSTTQGKEALCSETDAWDTNTLTSTYTMPSENFTSIAATVTVTGGFEHIPTAPSTVLSKGPAPAATVSSEGSAPTIGTNARGAAGIGMVGLFVAAL